MALTQRNPSEKLKRRRNEAYKEIHGDIREMGQNRISRTTKEKAMAAGDKFRAADVDLVFCQLLTYATSYNMLPAIRDLNVPVVLVNLQKVRCLDFEEEKVIKWGHDQLKYVSKNEDIRKVKDRFFRKDGEVPEGYKWDVGEYEGWLQFRWGNGRNSVEFGEDAVIDSKDNTQKCVRRCSIKKKKYRNFTYDESEELELDKLNEEILAINTN